MTTLSAYDREGTGTISIENVQKGLVSMNLVPATSNQALMDLFQSCDRDGQGNIDYVKLATTVQARETQGNPLFAAGYNNDGTASRMSQTRATPGTMLSSKHRMLKDALSRCDTQGTGTVSVETLKMVLMDMGVVTRDQVTSGEVDGFLEQHNRGGQVNYHEFADSIKREDMKTLAAMRGSN